VDEQKQIIEKNSAIKILTGDFNTTAKMLDEKGKKSIIEEDSYIEVFQVPRKSANKLILRRIVSSSEDEPIKENELVQKEEKGTSCLKPSYSNDMLCKSGNR
jgi:hypothetical protein